MRRVHQWRRPVHVEDPAVVIVPVLTLQDPLAAVGAVVLDCRPLLLPVSMDISGVDLLAVRFPEISTAMDGLLPGREQLSTGGGGGELVGTHLSGAWCDSFGGPRYRPGGRAADSGWFPVGSHRLEHAFVSKVGRRRGSGVGYLGGGGLTGDGDAHCGPCCRVFPVPTYSVPPSSQGVRGSLLSVTCNACMSCSDCFPDLP